MDFRSRNYPGQRRRLIDLRLHPGLQLKLPTFLIMITIGFSGLFLAHTSEAFGAMVEIGLEDLWQRALVEEIKRDYFVVSLSIALAYSVVVSGVCLAGTHRLLGPIVALRRQLRSVKRGDYTSRIHLRAGHPLSAVAKDLNELSEILSRSSSSNQAFGSENTQFTTSPAIPVERLLTILKSEDSDKEFLEQSLASVTG